MKLHHLLIASALTLGSMTNAIASEDHDHSTQKATPMAGMSGMGMMNPEKMQKMMAMKKAHMKKMEKHLESIDASLKELVALQKNK